MYAMRPYHNDSSQMELPDVMYKMKRVNSGFSGAGNVNTEMNGQVQVCRLTAISDLDSFDMGSSI